MRHRILAAPSPRRTSHLQCSLIETRIDNSSQVRKLQPHPRAEAHRNKIFAYIEKLIKHVASKDLGACELVFVCACMCDERKRLCVFVSV